MIPYNDYSFPIGSQYLVQSQRSPSSDVLLLYVTTHSPRQHALQRYQKACETEDSSQRKPNVGRQSCDHHVTMRTFMSAIDSIFA